MEKEPESNLDNLNELLLLRRQKLDMMRASGDNPFKSKFERTHLLKDIIDAFGAIEPGGQTGETVAVAGRIMAIRRHGKASFIVVKDRSESIQLFLSLGVLGEE